MAALEANLTTEELVPFRVHFEGADVPHYDTMATNAMGARQRAEKARPGELIRKIKVIREKADD